MTPSAKGQPLSPETVRDAAQRLLELVQQETQILAQKDYSALWELFPEKERLAHRLVDALRLQSREAQTSGHAVEAATNDHSVRDTLRRIEAINEANGRYMAELLTIHQELLSLLVPQTYDHGAHKALPAIKGCGLETEA
ncbi:flagellar export chaperone FlgN [Desulfosoma caldarium]|uniref:FlgN protein n=1 Tax=Desulfosoma caldarium TaxID=610254 RepID=A0A3N1VNU4_9BACT|nr:flagellar export chaperone FlgN [Desulfosoma caldarium]ROR01902.1 FlgN protein [Desulfosoma caldarium]